jgi:hypothetical protein
MELADPEARRTRLHAALSASTLLQWGIAAACSAFLWALLAVASRLSPTNFAVLVRGVGSPLYRTSFTLITPTADQLLLLVCSASILAILELRIQGMGYLSRIALMVPALLIASFVISPAVLLSVGAIGTVAGILYLVLHSTELIGVSPRRMLSSILILLAASTAVVYSASAVRWVLDAFDGAQPLNGWNWSPSLLGLKLLNEPYWLMPGLILLLFVCWPFKLLLEVYWAEPREDKNGTLYRVWGRAAKLSPRSTAPGSPGTERLASDSPTFLLLLSLAGSLFVGLYPYLPGINPKSTLVGYDANIVYFPSLRHMLGQSPLSSLAYAFRDPRGVFLLFQYFLALLTGSAGIAVRIVPAILAALLTVSTYYFVRAGVKDRLVAATAALFAAFSLLAVSGINGGLNADWLATSEALVFFSLLLMALNRHEKRLVAFSAVASVLILFTHPWTWLLTLGVVAAYAIMTAGRAFLFNDSRDLRFELASVGSILVVNLAVNEAKQLLGSPSGVQAVAGSAGHLALSNIPTVLNSLVPTLSNWLGGALDNSLIIVLAIVGVIAMPDLGNRVYRLLLSWMAVASGGLLLYGYSLEFLQARVILIAPLQVLAAMGLLSLLRYLTGLMGAGGNENQRLVKIFVALVYISVFCAMLGYALQNVGFVYTGLF